VAKRSPWKKANPRKKAGKKSKNLSPAQKAKAKSLARQKGRRYPSLVDNMNAAEKVCASCTNAAKTRCAHDPALDYAETSQFMLEMETLIGVKRYHPTENGEVSFLCPLSGGFRGHNRRALGIMVEFNFDDAL
jgi:hypothetical protein